MLINIIKNQFYYKFLISLIKIQIIKKIDDYLESILPPCC